MEFKISCSCGQRVLVDSSAGGQEFNCPGCGGVMTVPTVGESPPLPPLPEPETPAQAPNTTIVEFTCVGNAGNNYINAQISVYWFDVKVDPQTKTVLVIHRFIPMKSYHRESRVNYCEYEIPNEVICIVMRHVQTKPETHEYRFFKVQDGKFHPLVEGCIADFTRLFLQEYKGYSITGMSESTVRHYAR